MEPLPFQGQERRSRFVNQDRAMMQDRDLPPRAQDQSKRLEWPLSEGLENVFRLHIKTESCEIVPCGTAKDQRAAQSLPQRSRPQTTRKQRTHSIRKTTRMCRLPGMPNPHDKPGGGACETTGQPTASRESAMGQVPSGVIPKTVVAGIAFGRPIRSFTDSLRKRVARVESLGMHQSSDSDRCLRRRRVLRNLKQLLPGPHFPARRGAAVTRLEAALNHRGAANTKNAHSVVL